MIDILYRKIADKEAKKFINDCLGYDIPRIAQEVYPEDVNTEFDIPYVNDGKKEHLMDVYCPAGASIGNEAFILIHGGAFVYGDKVNDKNFGMRLSSKSGIPVFNINYTLMPEVSLPALLNEIALAMNFISDKYGIEVLHTVGDSAGGYLAVMAALIANDNETREDMMVPEVKARVESIGSVCGMYVASKTGFPGIYFANKNEVPEYSYDLYKVVNKISNLRVAIVTGEADFLRQENIDMNDALKALGNDARFYEAKNTPEREMAHVYPITNPTTPEGEIVISVIADNAVSRK